MLKLQKLKDWKSFQKYSKSCSKSSCNGFLIQKEQIIFMKDNDKAFEKSLYSIKISIVSINVHQISKILGLFT
mgnify:CR=1 FL=1